MDALVVAFAVALYANLPALAGRFGLAAIVGAVVMGLIFLPAFFHAVVRRRGIVVDVPWLLLVGFTGSLAMTTAISRDPDAALRWLGTFALEVLLVYFLLVNAVRSVTTVRRVVWGLMITAAILGLLAAYQELAHAPEAQFGGLAQRQLERGPAVEARLEGAVRVRDNVVLANRALGPIGDPNRFAQVLLFVLPLAAFRVRDERSRGRRALAALCTFAILGGVFLTYSRGAFLALAVLVALALLRRDLRLQHVVPVVVLGAVLAFIVAPGSMLRLQRLADLPRLLADRQVASSDGAVRGRLTEMLAAMNVFLDHPWIGVGPAHYSAYYSETYMADPDVAFRQLARPRRAHNLYLELAAETGIIGIVGFLLPLVLLVARLHKLSERWKSPRQPERAHLAAAFVYALVSYAATAMFLHLSFARYLGLLLGLAAATVQVLAARNAVTRAAPAPADIGVANAVATANAAAARWG
jgi:hypothetical protein